MYFCASSLGLRSRDLVMRQIAESSQITQVMTKRRATFALARCTPSAAIHRQRGEGHFNLH
jgi:hypothetical protein